MAQQFYNRKRKFSEQGILSVIFEDEALKFQFT